MTECEHTIFTRKVFARYGCPPVCRHCGTKNSLPFKVVIENNKYVLRCIWCNQIILKEENK